MKKIMILLFMLVMGCSSKDVISSFKIVNNSNKTIKECNVTVSGQEYKFKNLAPQTEDKGEFVATSDSSYLFNVIFDDGITIKKELGYVTYHFKFNDVFNIESDDVVLLRESVDK